MARRQVKGLKGRARAILEWMLAHPEGRYGECARELGVSENWISIVANSAVFRAELGRRRALIERAVEERAVTAASRALDRLAEEVARSDNPWFVLRAADALLRHCVPKDEPLRRSPRSP